MPTRHRAFTLIELIVTVSIIALLIAAGSVFLGRARRGGRDGTRIADILSISKAIDESVVTNRGVYPSNKVHPSDISGVMCADEMGTSLDVIQFSGRIIPKDPLPLISDRNLACTSSREGYAYYTGKNGALATRQNVAYSLEALLENPKTTDENVLSSPTELNMGDIGDTDLGRFRYILNGTSCGSATCR
jgi:prepilin-type N-terminal cleavage/methylation domain-containing protein